MLFRLGQGAVSAAEGRLGFFESAYTFDVFVGEAAAFVLDQEGVFSARHCAVGAGAAARVVYWVSGSRMHGCVCGGAADGCSVD